ncbi:MAG: ECF transporter S component [Oscillospiraceae bacterium]|nr:ECF transporter S component [Oscillospiraceae bacterium]
MQKTNSAKIRQLTILGMLTAIVVVLQFLGSFIRFGVFSISLVLIPIVVGAALCGPASGAWLGFVFGVVVLISGDASAFLAVNVPGTIFICVLKGTCAGLFAGLVFSLVNKLKFKGSKYVATVAAAVACPVVNTGIFLIGCFLFFYDTVAEWASALGYQNAVAYMFLVLAGGNFLFELLFNVILSPVIVRIVNIGEKTA